MKRDQIVALKTDGVTQTENVKRLKVCRKTVHDAWKQLQESGTPFSKSSPGSTLAVFTNIINFAT